MSHADRCRQAQAILKNADFRVYDSTSNAAADDGWNAYSVSLTIGDGFLGREVIFGGMSWNFFYQDKGNPFRVDNDEIYKHITDEQRVAIEQALALFS
ncbi:hypothetical protein P4S95_09360 [Aneurinibacillus aneurinilyticus]|uniref:hypothetical protein n=1 Tax=Aneurinibacillus aneurinilyticus TaxID=1391 RepID=UPI002E23742D|nr:hypothetical protein [Aneurinibacillus aneurinilyticus]